jgi:hypothetical protein
MGSHFLTLHTGSPDAISTLKKKDHRELLDHVKDPALRDFVVKILEENFTRDSKTLEHPDGHHFVRAFEVLSQFVCKQAVTLELYDDDEETPELWNFIWSEWEPEDYFFIPLSPYGTPKVTYKNNQALVKYLDQFKSVRKNGGYQNNFVGPKELDSLISTIESAIHQGLGVFVFIEY